ncbi:MAG: TolC family protein [Elusimicrobia bacterium]|nr:TolC family protein [Elusimicrobiota bacterium]
MKNLAVLFLIAAAAPSSGQPPAPLSLKDCVRIALEKSPDLAVAQGRLAQASAEFYKSFSAFSPQGTFSAQQTQLGYDQFGNRNKGNRWEYGTRSAEVSATWNVFNGFRDFDRWRAARWDRAAAAETLAEARRRIVLDTIRAYFGILLGDRSIEAQGEDLKSKQEHAGLSRARFKAGVRSYSDVLNAQIQMKRSEIELIRQESAKASALHALNILLARPLSEPTTVADELAFEPVREDLTQNLKDALARRPEMLKAQDELSSAQAGRDFAFHDLLPALTVNGLYDYTVTGIPLGAGAAFPNRNPYWQVNLGLSFAFFDGGRRYQEIRRTGAGVRIAEQNLEKARRTVSKEVSDAFLDLDKNQRIYEISKTQAAAAKEDLNIVSERYKNGAASVLEVVDAQANLLRVQLEAIQSLYNFHIARFELKRSVGLNPLGLPEESR